MPGTGRVQPAQGAQGPLLELGGELGQHADRSPRPERQLDQGPRRRQRRQACFDLVDGQARQRDEPRSVQGFEPEKRQGRTQALERVGRAQSAEAGDRRLVAAAQSARPGLEDPAAAEGRRRALRAEHERLPVNRDHRLGDEELSELGHAGTDLVRFQQRQDGRDLGRPQVQLVAPAMAERANGLRRSRRPRPRGCSVACRYPGAASSWPRRISA